MLHRRRWCFAILRHPYLWDESLKKKATTNINHQITLDWTNHLLDSNWLCVLHHFTLRSFSGHTSGIFRKDQAGSLSLLPKAHWRKYSAKRSSTRSARISASSKSASWPRGKQMQYPHSKFATSCKCWVFQCYVKATKGKQALNECRFLSM